MKNNGVNCTVKSVVSRGFDLRRPRWAIVVLSLAMLDIAGWGAAAAQLDLVRLGAAVQSGDLSSVNAAGKAIDGQVGTFSATPQATNSCWEVELERPYLMTRVELVTPSDPMYRNAASGLTLRIFDLRDRTVYRATVSDPGLGGTWSVDLPSEVYGRIIRFGLENGQSNGAGLHQVALAEVRAFGDPSPAVGPVNLRVVGIATQSSDFSAANTALKAIDGDPTTFSQTADLADSYWLLTLDRPRLIRRVELVNRSDAAATRMTGLVLRILDDQSNSVVAVTVANPGLGAVWSFNAPVGTIGRFLRIGLENGGRNGAGDQIVSLAEVSVLTAGNLALGRDSYAVRFLDSLPPASYGNDGNYTTEFKTTDKSVDGYWEVDLGQIYALYSVRAVAASGFTARLAHATVRLFDQNHDSVFSQHLKGASPTFDVDVGGPVLARYVRVGFENKERSDPAGGIEWYLGLREVQAFGRPAADVGLLAFTTSTNRIRTGQSATLSWRSAELHRLDLYPSFGSVGAHTDEHGAGTVSVSPAMTVEYWLVGTNRSGVQARAVTVEVEEQPLPVQISEFVANNQLSLEDGRNDAPDWIELHNPNNDAMNLAGYGLSDDPAVPMKWTFPSVVIPPHGYLIVFASGRNEPFEAGGLLHAGFQLDQDGESIVLTATNGVTVVDAVVAFPPQGEDLAYGRTIEGSLAFLDPTPGGPNLARSYSGWLYPLVFSHPRGFYTNAFSLSISNINAGADVYYSLNGREPSMLYSGPLAISSSVCVRAVVRRLGFKAPRVQTQSYVFVEKVVSAANMNRTITQDARYRDRVRRGLTDLPTFSIAVPQLPDDYVEREASVEIFWPDGAPHVQANCGFFRFGGAWTTFAKKNYRLKFREKYGARKLRAPLFRGFDRGFLAEEAFDEIDLGGGSHDMVERGFYLASRFAEDTMLDMGSLNPHGRFVNLYINGVYWGQYHARERLTDAFLADYLGGEREDYVNVRGNDNVGASFILGTPEPPSRYAWERVRALSRSYQSVRPYLDVSHLIDFMLMWSYGDAEAEYRAAGPQAAGTGFKFWLGDADGYLRTSALNNDTTGNAGPAGLFGALVAERNPDFMTLLADRIQRHFFLDGALTPARNLARLNERMNEITNSLVAECARWGFRTPDNWESAARAIRTGLFPDRTRNLLNFLRGRGFYPSVDPPLLNQYGGSVTNGFTVLVSANAGTIYYTLDGTDPRLPGGSVAPVALSVTTGVDTLIPLGSSWRYWDRGSLPGTNWNQRAFNDAAWPAGNAELGYGDGGEQTVLSFGGNSQNKHPAYYFRRAFAVLNPAAITNLVAELVRDDGAVVYLNGRELFRDNMPAGVIQHTTLAQTAVGGADESQTFRHVLPATNLVAGTNLLAVEVHQASTNSTDISFDLALSAPSSASAPGLVVQSNTVIRARARNGTAWSALVEARFLIAEHRPFRGDDVLISEIHYNPDGSDDYEFIELYNRGTNLLDLTGARLEGGVDFLFPTGFLLAPGGFALVVENASAFAARYRATNSPWYYPGLTVAGEWSGRLDDNGERIALLTSNRVETLAVSYRPDGSWPQRADGKGSSLELRAAGEVPTNSVARTAYLAQGRSWRSSSLYHGSPGRLDDYVRPVVINEVLAHTDLSADWIELHNPSAAEIDLFGMYLSDQYRQPFRFAFPDGSVIPAGGFLVLNSAQTQFGLSEWGSELLLIQASGTNLYRFVDTVDYAAVDREETVGRFVRSDGFVDFTELRAATQAKTNTLPRVGPVVFSEIMYHPAAGLAEYAELLNISSNTVALHDPARPANTWTLSGAVAYTFPPGEQIPPCVPIIVCSTNPAAFRAQYGVDAGVAVYGPWIGSLNNTGEPLKLNRPGEPEPAGTLSYYRVDRVHYERAAPWPLEANRGGTSLERVTLEGYGNDPGNWQPSAGGATPGTVVGNRALTIDVIGWTTVAEGNTVLLRAQAADANTPLQTVSISVPDLPPGSRFDPASGTFSWPTREADGPGTYAIRFIAVGSAQCSGASTRTITITVEEMNQPPVLGPRADLRYPADTPFRLRIEGSDPDLPAQRLTFSQSGLPPGLAIESSTGWITGRALATGVHHVVVSVADDQTPPQSASLEFTLTLTPPFALQLVSPADASPRRFRFQGLSNNTYEIQYSDVLEPADWRSLQRIESAVEGFNEFSDPGTPAPMQRFYRVLWLTMP